MDAGRGLFNSAGLLAATRDWRLGKLSRDRARLIQGRGVGCDFKPAQSARRNKNSGASQTTRDPGALKHEDLQEL